MQDILLSRFSSPWNNMVKKTHQPFFCGLYSVTSICTRKIPLCAFRVVEAFKNSSVFKYWHHLFFRISRSLHYFYCKSKSFLQSTANHKSWVKTSRLRSQILFALFSLWPSPPQQSKGLRRHFMLSFLMTIYSFVQVSISEKKVTLQSSLAPTLSFCTRCPNKFWMQRIHQKRENSLFVDFAQIWGFHQNLLGHSVLKTYFCPWCQEGKLWGLTVQILQYYTFCVVLHTSICPSECDKTYKVIWHHIRFNHIPRVFTDFLYFYVS